MKKIIALVCCRGDSKGIPNKNIKLFCGKPLLFWTYKNINKSGLFDRIFLSTDSKKISKIGKKIGFEVPELRPKYLAKSNSDVFETHSYFFKKFNINNTNSLVCIINNNPFIGHQLIKKTFIKYANSNYKKITMCVIKVDKDQIFFRQFFRKRNTLYPIFPKDLISSKVNRQQIEEFYFNIGDLRWASPSSLSSYKSFNKSISKKGFVYVEINKEKYNDINLPEDWSKAEKKFLKQ
jgi:CMP-N-acetylneuraminic acid synthetase